MINTRSIKFQLVAWYSGLIIIVAVMFGVVTYRDIEAHLLNTLELTLRARAEHLSEDILPRFNAPDSEPLRQSIDRVFSPEATARFIRVTAEDGTVLYHSPPPESGLFDPTTVPADRPQPGVRRELTDPTHSLYILSINGRLMDRTVRIEMGGLMTEIDLVLEDLRSSLMLGLPLVALVVSVGGYMLVQRSLKRVETLSATAQEISFGRLDIRLPVIHTGDEIEHLSVRLNQMLDRLAKAYDQASRFSADASHELRTPLTIIRAELESLVQQSKDLPAGVPERLGSVIEEVEHISFITESLFAVSRLDAGEAKIRDDRLDLANLVRLTVDQMRLLTETKNITLSIQGDPSVFVLGDAARLKQMLVGLLDNAIKYTPEGGAIVLTVSELSGRALLNITDTGIGIAKADLPHVFERFWRADKARSREAGGAGLGLAIVRSICEAHGGSVDILSTEGVGTSFHIRIPLAV